MQRLPTLFFATAGLFALAGMIWGIVMSATGDHTLAPAHGHLNLIGFVAMAIFGTYYALTPEAGQSRLAGIHYGLVVLTVALMVPGIVYAIQGTGETLAKLGSILGVLAMALFVFIVVKNGVGARGDARAVTPA